MEDFSLPVDTVDSWAAGEEADHQNGTKEDETNVFLNICRNNEEHSSIVELPKLENEMLLMAREEQVRANIREIENLPTGNTANTSSNTKKVETEDGILLSHNHIQGTTSAQAAILSISSLIALSKSLGTATAFAAIIEPLNSFLGSSPLLCNSQPGTLVGEEGFLRSVMTFLYSCLQSENAASALSLLVRIVFLRNSLKMLLEVATKLMHIEDYEGGVNLDEVTEPIKKATAEFLNRNSLIDTDVMNSPKQHHIRHDKDLTSLATASEGGVTKAFATSKNTLWDLMSDRSYDFDAGVTFTSITILDGQMYGLALREDNWSIHQLDISHSDKTVKEQKLKWPVGLVLRGTHHLHLTSCKDSLVVVVGEDITSLQHQTEDSPEALDLLRLVEDQLPDFGTIVELIHSNDVPFDLIVDDVRRQLDERQLGDHSENLPAALRVASREYSKTENTPSVKVYKLQPDNDSLTTKSECTLHVPPVVSPDIFEFEGGMSVSESQKSPPALATSSPITFEAWVRFRSLHSCTLIFIGTQAAHFYVAVGTGNGSGNYVAGGWKGGVYSPTAVGRLDSRAALSEWVHIAVAHEVTSTKVYLNGEITESILLAESDEGNRQADSLFLGRSGSNDLAAVPRIPGNNVVLGYDLHGAMREVRVWTHARTQNEIISGMRSTIPPEGRCSSMLWAHWPMCEGVGIQLFDNGAYSINLKPLHDVPCKGGTWTPLPRDEDLPVKYQPSKIKKRPPLTAAFAAASVTAVEERICIMQPFAHRQAASEFCLKTGMLISERYTTLPEGPMSLDHATGDLWYICNRMAILNVAHSKKHFFPKAPLLAVPSGVSNTASVGKFIVRTMALASLLGHHFDMCDTKEVFTHITKLLHTAEDAPDVYACLVILTSVASILTTGGNRLPKRDIAITDNSRKTLLPKLSEIRNKFLSSTLPIKTLVIEATSTCIDLVYTTAEERSLAFVDCVIDNLDQTLTGELAAHSVKPENAFILLQILLGDDSDRLEKYIKAIVSMCVANCIESIKAQTETTTNGSLCDHVAVFQTAVVCHCRKTKNSDLLSRWIELMLSAAIKCISLSENMITAGNCTAVIGILKLSFVGALLPNLLVSISTTELCKYESIALQTSLGNLRTKINEFQEKISSFDIEEGLNAFSEGIYNDVRIRSQYLSSTHPYRTDNCCSVCVLNTCEFTLSFDNRSRLDQRDELVILYIDPEKKTTKIKTIKDGLSLAKVVVNTNSLFVFARGSPRVSIFGGFGRGPSVADSQRQKWGFAFTAKASGRCPQFRIGWMCELVMISLSVSCSISQGMISLNQFNGADASPTYHEIFTGGLRDSDITIKSIISDEDWSDVVSRAGALSVPTQERQLRLIVLSLSHLFDSNFTNIPHSVMQRVFSLRSLVQSSSEAAADITKRAMFLLTSVFPIPKVEMNERLCMLIIKFICSDVLVADITNTITEHRAKAKCRLQGVSHLRTLHEEVMQWRTKMKFMKNQTDPFTLQSAVSALIKGCGGKLYTSGIELAGEKLLLSVRNEVQQTVKQLIDSAMQLQSYTAMALAQSLLCLQWEGEADFNFLAKDIPAVELLKESSLKKEVINDIAATENVCAPHGQSVSPNMIKGEDANNWHLVLEGSTATVRHDGRNANTFLWNSHDVRKGKSIVHLTKPWDFNNAPNNKIWYFEIKFLECSHRVAKGLGIGLCIQNAPLSQYITYKNSGAVKSHSVSMSFLLPSYRLFDVVGCGVMIVDGSPHMFFTRNGDYFGLIEHLGPQTMLPCVLLKYASKVQFLLTPDKWIFDTSKITPKTTARNKLSARQQFFQKQAELQSWSILRKWACTAAATVNDGSTQLLVQCLLALREHTLACLKTESGCHWTQKHAIVIYNAAKSASNNGTLNQFRTLLKSTGWGPVLYYIIKQGIEGCSGGGKAAETILQTLTILLLGVQPDDELAMCVNCVIVEAEAFIFKKVCKAVDSDCCMSEIDEGPSVSSNSSPPHSMIKLLLRGASELSPFLSDPNSEKKSVASSCIKLLRVLASNEVWAPVIESPLVVALNNCPRTPSELHHDLTTNNGKCVIAAFTALSIFEPTSPVGSRGTKCLLKTIYGTPQNCVVTSISDGPVRVVLVDDPSLPEIEVSAERITPLRDNLKLLCKTTSACVADLCSAILASTSIDTNTDTLPSTTTSLDLEAESTTTFRCPRKELPKTCIMAALLYNSLVATQETLTDVDMLKAFPAHAVSALSCRKLAMPATITELEQRKNICISELEAGEWKSVRKEVGAVTSSSDEPAAGWPDIGNNAHSNISTAGNEDPIELAVVGVNPTLRNDSTRRESWQSGIDSSEVMDSGLGLGIMADRVHNITSCVSQTPPVDSIRLPAEVISETSSNHSHDTIDSPNDLPPYEQQEFALEDEKETAKPSEEAFIRSKPISVLWTRCLTWYGALSAAAARCLLLRISVAIAESGTVQGLSTQELLAVLDATILMGSSEQHSIAISQLIGSQEETHTVTLTVESLRSLGLSSHSENCAFATEPFNLIMLLVELLVKLHPTVLIRSDEVIHAFCKAIHVNSQQKQRIRILRCFCNLVQRSSASDEIASNWSCLGVIRRRCEAKMSLLSLTQSYGVHHEVPMATAELLYFVRKMLLCRGRDFNKEVVAITGQNSTKWCIGLLVDKLDVDVRRWHEAVVIAVSKTKVHVTCKGHPSIQDEWLDKSSSRLRKHIISRPVITVTRQQFGSFNDVSNVLSNSRRIQLSHTSARLAVNTPVGDDELTLAASNDIRVILSHSSGKGYVPRWYECTSSNGNMYTVIVDHMIAVDMHSAVISPLVSVGECADFKGIPFQLYQAIEHLADCVSNSKSIPSVWGKHLLSDSVLRGTPLSGVSKSIMKAMCESYENGIPESEDQSIPSVESRVWNAAIHHCEQVASSHEDDPPIPIPTHYMDEPIDVELTPYIGVIHALNFGIFLPCLHSMNQHPEECVVVDCVTRLKRLLLKEVKNCITTTRIVNDVSSESGNDTVSATPIQVQLDRQRPKRPGAGIRDSLLGQLQSQLDCHPPSILAIGKPPFRVSFLGEAGIDQGGIFRDTLTALASELMSGKSLFIQREGGFFVNTELDSTYDHSMFRCVGRLMAVCIRSDDLLALDLHGNIWLMLTREKFDPRTADVSFYKTLEWVQGIDSSVSEKDFADLELTFTIPLGDGKIHELIKNGKDTSVTLNNRTQYVELAMAYKSEEGTKQIESIRQGILDVLPVALLNLSNSNELEEHVCGQREVDVDLLIKNATYGRRLSVNCNVVENFWAALKTFSQSDLHSFLRFITGRPRLPLGKSVSILIDSIDEPKDGLPESHTCSSLICLPPYSSAESMRKQLLYGVRNCDTTDIA